MFDYSLFTLKFSQKDINEKNNKQTKTNKRRLAAIASGILEKVLYR